ncbi:uncharacterized protein LOC143264492 [Megachile rotundata]|uniref:uncharacterized protein LOC143264492 n=1 Tax=Megachile rotundata TaxID=143995 RepID=UPI003FD4C804
MYGYSLPKNKDGILYYEIKFLMPKSNIFIYPSLCIISGPVDIIPNRDKEPTITQFLSDMLIKLPVVCNTQLKVSKNTPFNTTLGNTSSLVDTLLKNTELNAHSPKNNITSSAQLEFSAKYVNELTKNSNRVSTSLKTHLAMIHQLHNIPVGEDANTLNIENTDEHQNVLPAKKKLCIKSIVSKELNDNFTLSKEIAISKYFPIQKPDYSNTAEQEKQKQLSLKEKLLKAKSNESDEIQKSTLEIDENVNIEAMARNNQLHQLHNNVLSNWLQQHSIPHKPKETKTELINKILSHIKNTQVLHKFRM